MSAVVELDWTTANQHLLVAEFARLRALLGEGDLAEATNQVKGLSGRMPAPATIDTMTHLFQLSPFERDLLLLVCGVEMDARLAALCADANSQPGQPWPTFGLALAALPEPHWSAIAPLEALRRWRLIEVDENKGLTAGRLKLDERVLHFIGGINYLDHRLRPLVNVVTPAELMAEPHRVLAQRAADQLRAQGRQPSLIVLTGDDPGGQEDVAATLAENLGVALFRLQARDIPAMPHEQANLASLWQREAALLGSGLVITQADEAPGDDSKATITRFIAQIEGLLIVAGRSAPLDDSECQHHVVNRQDAPGQRQLWTTALGDNAGPLGDTISQLASQYRLGARQIARISERITGTDSPRDVSKDSARLHQLCRGNGSNLGALAQLIETRATWDDLVLPDSQIQTLKQILIHTQHRITVHHDWGFADKSSRGTGIATLFSGESGTGKTLAAEVLAKLLDVTLYRVDLSSVVSKYIGETEKNLRKLFDAAEDMGALLLFDEADALFGKRSEVKDSHDRYANIEVSYLLQRMEAYRGLAILTSNHKTALDTAFQRRLRFVVHFPFPDAVQREAIWRIIFPERMPLGELDCKKLARLNVTGGTIRNIALGAAFLAAEAGTSVQMEHLLRAAHREAAKLEKTPTVAETRGWV